ncbi:MAG: hypothetical protein KKH61_20530 [Gammaproteobacteria bacterium]|nr:hypothetical protein [Gammaproteobacteria bacterium]
MSDFGYVTVTTTCPVTPADGDTDTRIFGVHGDTVYRNIKCPEGHDYTIGVVLTVSGAATEYVIN